MTDAHDVEVHMLREKTSHSNLTSSWNTWFWDEIDDRSKEQNTYKELQK